MVLVPTPAAAASPPVEVIVATEAVPDAQFATDVRINVELSEYVPVAMNCCVVPFAIEGFKGVTAIDVSVGAVTVSVVEPDKPP